MRITPEIRDFSTELKAGYSYSKKSGRTLSGKFWFIFSISLAVLLSLLTAVVIATAGLKYALAMVVITLALPCALAVIAYPKFGIITLLVAAYFIMWFIRMKINFPLGTVMDGIEALLILGFFLHQKFHPDWKSFRNPISVMILLWIGYNILQVANPTAESRLAWVYTVRSVAVVMLMYFIFTYHIKTISFLKVILKLWIGLSTFAALYAIKQEHLGFFAFEEADFSDPLVVSLLFINGVWRKFSIFSDPVAFAYNMVISTVFCMSLLMGPVSQKRKMILIGLSMTFVTAMLYSATRGAYVLLPATAILFIVMHLNKKIITMSIFGAIFMLMLINVPTSNVTLYRFQSAFKPSDDASFNVRKKNQKRMQAYIQTHPFGGGLGSTGAWGARFAPHSFLAQLPPDSGFFRVAVELGWIGLLLFCGLLFTVLRQGILNYYAIEDPELKSYCLGMTLVVFALNVGSYPQEALVQFPTNIYFYLFISLINTTLKLDLQAKQLKLGTENVKG